MRNFISIFHGLKPHKAYIFNNLITRNSCERHYRIFIAEVKGKPLKIRLKRGVSFTFLQPIIVVRDWTQRGNDIVAFHPNSDEKHGTWILSVIYGIMRQGVIRFSNYAVRRTTATEKKISITLSQSTFFVLESINSRRQRWKLSLQCDVHAWWRIQMVMEPSDRVNVIVIYLNVRQVPGEDDRLGLKTIAQLKHCEWNYKIPTTTACLKPEVHFHVV